MTVQIQYCEPGKAKGYVQETGEMAQLAEDIKDFQVAMITSSKDVGGFGKHGKAAKQHKD